ncbi:hypothetical protein IU449_07750 [Nocardia higoensis]|uniref:Uncharacterized protein n=1 Tax=Nocardia higoensis TaxID=228599 RepID=A0ABS0DC07_9NOCA|nr:hypothetical protein [Nocardia higoensis]MBF6354434.1 hypothetical protein [Nocardia higoensis]
MTIEDAKVTSAVDPAGGIADIDYGAANRAEGRRRAGWWRTAKFVAVQHIRKH